jgi:hypothetical protein
MLDNDRYPSYSINMKDAQLGQPVIEAYLPRLAPTLSLNQNHIKYTRKRMLNFQTLADFDKDLFEASASVVETLGFLNSAAKKKVSAGELFDLLTASKFYPPSLSIEGEVAKLAFRGQAIEINCKSISARENPKAETNFRAKAAIGKGANAFTVDVNYTPEAATLDLTEEIAPLFKAGDFAGLAKIVVNPAASSIADGSYTIATVEAFGKKEFPMMKVTTTEGAVVITNTNIDGKVSEFFAVNGGIYQKQATGVVGLSNPGAYDDLKTLDPSLEIESEVIIYATTVIKSTKGYAPQSFALVQTANYKGWCKVSSPSIPTLSQTLIGMGKTTPILYKVDAVVISDKSGKPITKLSRVK